MVELKGEAHAVFDAASRIAHIAKVYTTLLYTVVSNSRITGVFGDSGVFNPDVQRIGADSGARIWVPTTNSDLQRIELEGSIDEVRTCFFLLMEKMISESSKEVETEEIILDERCIGPLLGDQGKLLQEIRQATNCFIKVDARRRDQAQDASVQQKKHSTAKLCGIQDSREYAKAIFKRISTEMEIEGRGYRVNLESITEIVIPNLSGEGYFIPADNTYVSKYKKLINEVKEEYEQWLRGKNRTAALPLSDLSPYNPYISLAMIVVMDRHWESVQKDKRKKLALLEHESLVKAEEDTFSIGESSVSTSKSLSVANRSYQKMKSMDSTSSKRLQVSDKHSAAPSVSLRDSRRGEKPTTSGAATGTVKGGKFAPRQSHGKVAAQETERQPTRESTRDRTESKRVPQENYVVEVDGKGKRTVVPTDGRKGRNTTISLDTQSGKRDIVSQKSGDATKHPKSPEEIPQNQELDNEKNQTKGETTDKKDGRPHQRRQKHRKGMKESGEVEVPKTDSASVGGREGKTAGIEDAGDSSKKQNLSRSGGAKKAPKSDFTAQKK